MRLSYVCLYVYVLLCALFPYEVRIILHDVFNIYVGATYAYVYHNDTLSCVCV